jgi:photosystem II stability/assembly factor-like uncharacterized protein
MKKNWLCVVLAAVLLGAGCEQPSVTKPSPQPAGVIEMKMMDEKTGWALSAARFFRTEDGGERWTPVLTFYGSDVVENGVPKPLDPDKVHAAYLGTEEVWISEATEGGVSPVSIQHSRDGGRTWETFPAPAVGELHFVDSLHGYLFGESGVLKTSDGGKTWK